MKINSIKQLQQEKKKLSERRQQAEQNISRQWSELKNSMKPVNVAKETMSHVLSSRLAQKSATRSLLLAALGFGSGVVARKLLFKALKRVVGR